VDLLLLLILAELWLPGVQGVLPEDELAHQHAGASARQTSGALYSAQKKGELHVASMKKRSPEDGDVQDPSPEEDVNGKKDASTSSQEADASQAAASISTQDGEVTEQIQSSSEPSEEAESSNADVYTSDAIDLTSCDVGSPEEGKLDEYVAKLLDCAKQRKKHSGAVAALEKVESHDLESYRTMVSTIVTKLKDTHGHGEGLTGPFESDQKRIKATLSQKLNEMLTEVNAWPNSHALKKSE